MNITVTKLVVAISAWAAVFFSLSLLHFNPFGLLSIIGFPFLVVVPGYLTVLLLKLSYLRGATKLLMSVGLSVAELMFIALLGNILLPLVGIDRPLDAPALIIEIGLFVTGLLIAVWIRSKKHDRQIVDEAWHLRRMLPTWRDVLFAFVPLLFVGLAVMGAISLNNGASNAWTLGMLVGTLGYLGALIYYINRLHTNSVLFGLFFVALAFLLMTSLRGWYITGHDIQHEFRLFLEAAESGVWMMGTTNDAYNACLSITLLPTIFYKLLGVQSFYVFKVLFQILFALAPIIVFIINRNFISKRLALLTALYFMAFPTFFADMPMLIRQEVAFLFAGIGLLILFNRDMPLYIKRSTFFVMALGVIVSHYSTNYTLLALLTVCAVSLPVLRFIASHIKPKRRLYRLLNLEIWRQKIKPVVTLPMIILLVLISFLWSVQLTNSSGQAGKVVTNTITHIRDAIGAENSPNDDRFSYSTVSKLEDQQKLYRYFEQLSVWGRQRSGAETFYDPSTYNNYTFPIVDEQKVPLTPLGNMAASVGIRMDTVHSFMHINLARFLEIMIVMGAGFMLFTKRFSGMFSNEYRAVQAGALFIMVSMLAVPVLLADYDLSRMLQQLLFVSGAAVVIGSVYVIPKISSSMRLGIASFAVMFMLATMTGLFTAAFGGHKPQLHLYNAGTYYDLYYTHREERKAATWLNDIVEHKKDTEVQTDNIFIDRYTSFKVQGAVEQDLLDDVYPGLVRKDAYVLLGYTTVKKQQATAYYNGTLLTYKYPVEFLDTQKNLLYDNGGSRVYR